MTFTRQRHGLTDVGGKSVIRAALPDDVPVVLKLVRELAEFEREPNAVKMTEADLTTALFDDPPAAAALVATDDIRDGDGAGAAGVSDLDGVDSGDGAEQVVGFAIYHETFSTWTGRTGTFLVDLFVAPEHRRAGHGRALLAALAAVARDRGHRRLEWDVLDWNTPAHAFYRSLGAVPQEGWTTWRLDAAGIAALAAGS